MKRRSIAAIVCAASAGIALVLPGPFMVESAGPAINVEGKFAGKDLFSISGTEVFPSQSELFMTTVSAAGTAEQGVTGAQALLALLNPHEQIIPVRALYTQEQSAADVEAENAEMMTDSQSTAAVVALEALGKKSTMTLTVTGSATGSPAHEKLKKGDIIRRVSSGGMTREITTFSDLSSFLGTTEPGTDVEVTVLRDGHEQTFTLPTQAYKPDSTGWVAPGSQLGIYLATSNVHVPAEVTYAVAGIGGPSAGMMFALGIYDRLTPGSLGGDNRIAGTGTISYNSKVGPIGGIVHKMRGAAQEGVRYFLAPADNCAETIGHEPKGMSVFAVRSFDEAVEAVQAIADGNTAEVTTCHALATQAQGK